MRRTLWRLDSSHITSLPKPWTGLPSKTSNPYHANQTQCELAELSSALPALPLLFSSGLQATGLLPPCSFKLSPASGPCACCSLCRNTLSLDSCVLLSLLTLGLCSNATCQRDFSNYLISNNCPLHLRVVCFFILLYFSS